MNNTSQPSKLSFFSAEKYSHGDHTFNASCSPRPHFCMALLLKGRAHFCDCTGTSESFDLFPGEMVFVPVTTRYVSNWYGDPDVEYISFHFLFDYSSVVSKNNNYVLQKVTFSDPTEKAKLFEKAAEACAYGDERQFQALAAFYSVLFEVVPKLSSGESSPLDPRISDAVAYIEKNYTERITVEKLALVANMSESRFFPCFKSALGVTPVDYLNHYRISRAIILIVNDPKMSVDEISCAVGFESSTYFRRVFKSITGKNPRDYRKLNAEI